MLVRAPNGTYEFIDFRETAPAAAFEDMYKNNEDASINGGLASGVPGELRGLQHLHENYGKLPWKTVLTPCPYSQSLAWQGCLGRASASTDWVDQIRCQWPPATSLVTRWPGCGKFVGYQASENWGREPR